MNQYELNYKRQYGMALKDAYAECGLAQDATITAVQDFVDRNFTRDEVTNTGKLNGLTNDVVGRLAAGIAAKNEDVRAELTNPDATIGSLARIGLLSRDVHLRRALDWGIVPSPPSGRDRVAEYEARKGPEQLEEELRLKAVYLTPLDNLTRADFTELTGYGIGRVYLGEVLAAKVVFQETQKVFANRLVPDLTLADVMHAPVAPAKAPADPAELVSRLMMALGNPSTQVALANILDQIEVGPKPAGSGPAKPGRG